MSTTAQQTFQFNAVIQAADRGGTYVIFPHDIRALFGKGRVKVEAAFDGIPYSGSIVNMGVKDETGQVVYILGMLKSIRTVLGKAAQDTVSVAVTVLD